VWHKQKEFKLTFFSPFESRRLSTGPSAAVGQVNPSYEPDSAVEGRQTTVTFTGLSASALNSKPFTPLKKKSSLMSLWSNDSRDQKLKTLKQELEMDEHKIPLQTLFSRFKTDPVKVWYYPTSTTDRLIPIKYKYE
jgi:hypothetical protein